MRTHSRTIALASALTFAVAATSALAGDPGELFPDTSYEKAVSSPVKDPGRTSGHAAPVVIAPRPSRPEPVDPPPAVEPPKPDPVKPVAPAVPPAKAPPKAAPPEEEKPAAPAEENLVENVGYMVWAPYKVEAMKKFLSPEEQAEYEKDFEAQVKKALSGTVADRKQALDALSDEVSQRSDALKRFVLLQVVGMAIKNNAPLSDRSRRAMKVLPLLTEETLEVAQAKADCLWNLGMSAPEQANDKLWSMLAEAQASLAKLQVQAAFPKQATESLTRSKNAFNRMKEKGLTHSELIVEAQAWIEYANNANAQLPRLKQILKDSPKDADANTKVAMAHLVLYADLDAAEEYAQLSAKNELKSLASTLHKAKFPRMSHNTDAMVADSIRIAQRLLAVAKGAPEQIERYAIAKFVVDRIDDLKESAPDVTDNPWNTVRTEAAALMKANAFKPLVPHKAELANTTQPAEQSPRAARVQEFLRRFGGGGGGGGGGFGGGRRGGGRGRG